MKCKQVIAYTRNSLRLQFFDDGRSIFFRRQFFYLRLCAYCVVVRSAVTTGCRTHFSFSCINDSPDTQKMLMMKNTPAFNGFFACANEDACIIKFICDDIIKPAWALSIILVHALNWGHKFGVRGCFYRSVHRWHRVMLACNFIVLTRTNEIVSSHRKIREISCWFTLARPILAMWCWLLLEPEFSRKVTLLSQPTKSSFMTRRASN